MPVIVLLLFALNKQVGQCTTRPSGQRETFETPALSQFLLKANVRLSHLDARILSK